MRWGFDLKQVLAEEFAQLVEREKYSSFYRGETSIRPGPSPSSGYTQDDEHDSGESEMDMDATMTSDASSDGNPPPRRLRITPNRRLHLLQAHGWSTVDSVGAYTAI
ncbi:hypothetical protein B0H17DRAFT_1211186 [Mycena rosella]|uniref:Uncharacterized protein n=1 Tax=Mycena rosella TaxID=1033263 RepID=A0AAD7CW02_MYCRO|nr:hypothetical protein B0H17DRAFT_1211186 [Mycena rosella]